MDLQFPILQVLVPLLLLLIAMKRTRTRRPSPNLPPGPWKLPIIGSMHHLLGSTLIHRRLRDLATKHGSLMHLQLGQIPTLVASSPEMAKEIMKTHDLACASRPKLLGPRFFSYAYTDIVFAPYGEYWRTLKKLSTVELLSSRRVKSYQSIREEEVTNLIESVHVSAGADAAPVDLSEKLFELTNNVTARATFGTRSRHQRQFVAALKDLLELISGFGVADLFPSLEFVTVATGAMGRIKSVHRKLDSIITDIIDEHRVKMSSNREKAEVDEDYVDILLRLQEEGGLDFPLATDNIKALIMDLFGAGTETSGTTMEWVMSELMRNPQAMAKAQTEVREVVGRKGRVDESVLGEMTYLRLVIKETFRLHPPFPLLLPRESRERCEIGGYDVPAGTRILVNAWAIGRDPRCWDEPEAFKPERFLDSEVDFRGAHYEFIPFGAGRRICPGIPFALATMELALAQLLYCFDWEMPDGIRPEELDMTEALGQSACRKSPLRLMASARTAIPPLHESR